MADEPALNEEMDAYSLLSRPTLELTDEQVMAIIEQLRHKREAYIKTGKPDRPKKEKVERKKLDQDAKRRNTEALLAQLKLS